MLKLENTEVVGWEAAIRGMRNPMNSWAMSDTVRYAMDLNPEIGPKDFDLMKRLRNAGTDHRKYLRMIAVYVDVTAPLYWWKEFDTYKVGTVANSCSTMHKIQAKEFTLEDFSYEHLFDEDSLPPYEERVDISHCEPLAAIDVNGSWCYYTPKIFLKMTCNVLNHFRELYLKTKDKRYWWQMIQLLPSSYNQRRTVMLNYEVLANIYKSRRNHKLDEWHTFCDWIESLPYSELITGPSMLDIPISHEIMEEAKRRVHEELNAQFDIFSKLHEGVMIKIPKEKVTPEALELIKRIGQEEQQRFVIREETEDNYNGKQ